MKKKYTTSCWKLTRDEDIYRFQSDDPLVINKMRRRADFDLVAWGENAIIEIYSTIKSTPQSARKTLGRLTSSEIKKEPAGDAYYAETYTIVTFKEEAMVQINKEKGSHNDEGE